MRDLLQRRVDGGQAALAILVIAAISDMLVR